MWLAAELNRTIVLPPVAQYDEGSRGDDKRRDEVVKLTPFEEFFDLQHLEHELV